MFRSKERETRHLVNTVFMKLKDLDLKNLTVLVEGDSDIKLFERFFKNSNIVSLGGKPKVLEAFKYLLTTKELDLIAIVDSDFQNILNNKENIERLFYTDTHDIETLILSWYKFNNILVEQMDIDKYRSLNKNYLYERIMELAFEIGKRKLYSIEMNKKYYFKNLDYERFININEMIFDEGEFNKYISERSGSKFDTVGFNKYSSEKKIKNYDKLQVCSGHDISNLLELYIKPINRYIHHKKIEMSLRLSFESEKWKHTKLYENIFNWAITNNYNIFEEEEQALA